MRIVTGYTGQPHITSNSQVGFNQGIFSPNNHVLDVGNCFAASLTDATTVTIASGEGVVKGVHFRIDPGTIETVSISPGTTGYNRIDLICARYVKNRITGVESVSLILLEGEPSTGSAHAQSPADNDILNGAIVTDFPLYSVTLVGLTPTLSALFSPIYINYKTLLWTNPSLSSVETLSVDLNLSGYHGVEVVYKSTASAGHPTVRCTHYQGDESIALVADIGTAFYCKIRHVQVIPTRVVFTPCYSFNYVEGSGDTSTDSTSLVPYRIYGIY